MEEGGVKDVRGTLSRFVMWAVDVLGLVVSGVVAPATGVFARLGPVRLRRTFKLWDEFNVIPMRYHYYQPVTRVNAVPETFWERDSMIGLDLNTSGQLELLSQLRWADELRSVPIDDPGMSGTYFYGNTTFGAGDGEIYYSLIRHLRPRRIVEIGAGYSTLIGRLAIERNGGGTEHVCIEPFENEWLERTGARVLRERVETLSVDLFASLEANDILFIDSSHILRPGGDVWFEYLRILPCLKPGVLVHIHDIFLPYAYHKEWLVERRQFWNEQYLLQALLYGSREFQVVLALHLLSREHHEALAMACPIYAERRPMPSSFWLRKV